MTATLAALAVVAVTAQAHDTWLMLSSPRAVMGKPVEIRLTSGMAFASDDFAIEAVRLARAEARLGGTTTPITASTVHPRALHLQWTPAKPGIATIGVSLEPRDLELSPAQVDEYFADINASREVRDRWAKMPAPRRWRERYSKHAVTWACVAGAPSPDSSWASPMGLALEIVPERNPTSLAAGDTLAVRVLDHGKPLQGFMVGAQHDADTATKFVVTDRAGRARVALSRAGWWLINGTMLRPLTNAAREWDSDFTTMTISVAPAGSGGGC